MPLANPQRFRECREATLNEIKRFEAEMGVSPDDATQRAICQSLTNQALIMDMLADLNDLAGMTMATLRGVGPQPPKSIQVIRPGMK